jgi:DedD protein
MAESGVREIQLSGKQLVFLFMASVVLVVVVFLLGVSVGRGARASVVTAAPPDAVAMTERPIDAPPGTTTSAGNLTYPKRLPGGSGPAEGGDPSAGSTSAANPPVTTADTPRMNVPAPPATTPKTAPASVQTPVPEATVALKTPAPATAAKPPVAPPGSWFVQVESYRSKDLADALVAKLKTKGYDAFIVDVPKPLLHVRVGPYPQRSLADGVAVQLKKDGFSSLVTH